MSGWRPRGTSLCLVAVFCTLLAGGSTDYTGHYTNDFAVEIDGDLAEADLVADIHGFHVEKQLSSVGDGIFHFVHNQVSTRSKRSAEHLLSRLRTDPSVKRVEQQRLLTRVKREVIYDKQLELPIRVYDDKTVYQRFTHNATVTRKDEIPDGIEHVVFNDPYYEDQWYLVNTGQSGGPPGYDVNVESVWRKGITGKGVVVCILDDGVDHKHPDLAPNYDPMASTDLNDKTDRENDPTPDKSKLQNGHGTRCAGEVAAVANNSNCCVGIAYEAKIGGVRMLDGKVTDMLEAEALTFHNQHIDIYSASWGPRDDGMTMEGAGTYVRQAFKKGTTEGRKGKGSIFVWATGNGGENGDDCSADGYVSSIQSISIGSISDRGLSTYFSEVCPSTLAVIFTGGSHIPPTDVDYVTPKLKVVTTDLNGKCTLDFQGTSAAAPLAAGCFALVLQANPDLTWRDMQNLVVETSRIPNTQESGWVQNGAGYHVHHRFGFGAIDCGRLVEAAQNWRPVGEQHVCGVAPNNGVVHFTSRQTVIQTLTVGGCHGDPASAISHLEHVQLHVNMSHPYRGDITLRLTSPHGTMSQILKPREKDASEDGLDFTFMTVHKWGEDPRGAWTLNVTDVAPHTRSNHATLLSWSLTLYGCAQRVTTDSEATPASKEALELNMNHEALDLNTNHDALDLNTNQIKKVMDEEAASADNVQIDGGDTGEHSTNHVARKTTSHRLPGAYKRDDIDSYSRSELNVLARLLIGDDKKEEVDRVQDQRTEVNPDNDKRTQFDSSTDEEMIDNLLRNNMETRGFDGVANQDGHKDDAEFDRLIDELRTIIDKIED